mmetsp:Transcript_3069/g.6525  ORF Transcript_3069/g.6525 Transcript_3069/m.6525 type:complete len:206 (-) Transcript_3069:88-705(-)
MARHQTQNKKGYPLPFFLSPSLSFFMSLSSQQCGVSPRERTCWRSPKISFRSSSRTFHPSSLSTSRAGTKPPYRSGGSYTNTSLSASGSSSPPPSLLNDCDRLDLGVSSNCEFATELEERAVSMGAGGSSPPPPPLPFSPLVLSSMPGRERAEFMELPDIRRQLPTDPQLPEWRLPVRPKVPNPKRGTMPFKWAPPEVWPSSTLK